MPNLQTTPDKYRHVHRKWMLAIGVLLLSASSGWTSSHREAPGITEMPKFDCTDFYIFRSYEPGREDYVTLIANYIPLQDAYGGPNYFSMAPSDKARYEIHIDNNADSIEDITLQWRFSNTYKGIALEIGDAGATEMVEIPLINAGQITLDENGQVQDGALNLIETYNVDFIPGHRRENLANAVAIMEAGTENTGFTKPVDNIGNKSIPDYESYAQKYIYNIALPGTEKTGRMFVGQRKDPFVVNLGETFDLVNISTSPLGPVNANKDSLEDKNVTSIIIELPIEFLAIEGQPIIGAWATASTITKVEEVAPTRLSQNVQLAHNQNVVYSQVSRLGAPLVNEVVIGISDKDKWNSSEPTGDGQFLKYVTHPTLPELLEILFGAAGVKAPDLFPRADLIAGFLTGVEGLNKNGSTSEMLRLNTSIAPTSREMQSPLAVLTGDNAGFPNGRRPGDDVVDIALRVVMGVLLDENVAPSGKLPFTDGAYVDARFFSESFPYLASPLRGSPNDKSIRITLEASNEVTQGFQPVNAIYDRASQSLTTPQPQSSQGFFRLQSDAPGAELTTIEVQTDSVKLGLKASE